MKSAMRTTLRPLKRFLMAVVRAMMDKWAQQTYKDHPSLAVKMSHLVNRLDFTTSTIVPKAINRIARWLNTEVYFATRRQHRQKQFDYVVPLYGNALIHVDNTSVIEWLTYLRGEYDEVEIFKLYQRLLRPGSVAIDVGASVGFHSIVMSEIVGCSGTVIAFEPNPPAFERLIMNLSINGCVNVKAVPVALSHVSGERTLFDVDSYNQGMATFHSERGTSQKVQTITLDDYVQEYGITRCNLIKADVEGHELQVLRGAVAAIESFHPFVIFEHNSPPWHLSEVASLLGVEYRFYLIPFKPGGYLKPLTGDESLTGFNNVLAVPCHLNR